MKIAIVTDSTCDLPKDLVDKYNINVIPLRILYKGEEYRDNIDITSDEVYERLSEEVPTTSLPLPEDVEDLFQRLTADGYTHVISIHLSSGLSGTSQMIQNMADRAKGLVVKVIDSKSISMGLGYTVLEAARFAKEASDFESVVKHAQTIKERLKVYFVLDTLEYLIKGGRIGRVAGTLGQILNVKPIITVNSEGIYTTYAKVRGRRQSINKLREIVQDHVQKAASSVAVCHGAAGKEAKELIEQLRKSASDNINEFISSHVSPVIGVHTGPGTLGVVIYTPE